MRWSNYYLMTAREAPRDAEVISHQLMARSGLIRRLAAGIYTMQPAGWRTMRKLMAIVRREMERAGAVELSMPAIQPAEIWEESERWYKYGVELLRMEDRHGRRFCFGPTHEEVVTDLVRRDVKSYRQLPINLFQIQTKFRDEIRPRFGLMRGREFIMKDAYSFDANEEGLDRSYRAMHAAYSRIFEACGLEFSVVEADQGAIGGSSSHEFMVLADTGESAVASCAACGYGANVERAEVGELPVPAPTGDEAAREVETPGTTTVAQVAELLGVEPARVVKTLIYDTDDGLAAVAIRGDREVNETKLLNTLGGLGLRLATAEQVEAATGGPLGFSGPVGLAASLRLVVDESARKVAGFVCGANRGDRHFTSVSWDHDVASARQIEWVDVMTAEASDPCPRCNAGALRLSRGIEVGHIFKLGTAYSEKMNCTFTDEHGRLHPAEMGCYGLGIGRTAAAAIEQGHDRDGIVWPAPLAPFAVVLSSLDPGDEAVRSAADSLYEELVGTLAPGGFDVLYDDRAERPGVKFKDADLVGFPVRVVVGARSLRNGGAEVSARRDGEREVVALDRVSDVVLGLLR
ncbi:MAG: proline--tRNA ligase [Acidobacteria bacterium]|nr:proline--tRNA ligase [Acidobacteriota bacterium]